MLAIVSLMLWNELAVSEFTDTLGVHTFVACNTDDRALSATNRCVAVAAPSDALTSADSRKVVSDTS
jgi:hypothetical protein